MGINRITVAFITGAYMTICSMSGICNRIIFQGWQVNVFVHENYATNGDPTMRITARPDCSPKKTPTHL